MTFNVLSAENCLTFFVGLHITTVKSGFTDSNTDIIANIDESSSSLSSIES